MQSEIVALLSPAGSSNATLLVRRGNGQFAMQIIDARLAAAARMAAAWRRHGAPVADSPSDDILGYEAQEPA
jgi:hypothetical protein